MDKKSFTLIEVLMSVMIIGFMGTTILKVTSSNSFFMAKIFDKKQSNSIISALSDIGKSKNNQALHLKNMIVAKYPKANDDLITFLKDYKIDFKDELISTVVLGDDDKKKDEDIQDENKDENSLITLEIRKKLIQVKTTEESKRNSLEYIYYFVEKTK